MTISPESLRELHRIHKQLTDLRSRLARCPKLIAAADGAVKQYEAELEQSKDAAKKARITADQKQLQLRSREDKLQDLQGKLNAASSNKEYQALKDQMAADTQANLVLQDEILEALERIDELTAAVKATETHLASTRAEAAKVRKQAEAEQQVVEVELARIQQALKNAEAKLPADFRLEYDRIAKARGEDALAEVDGEVCGNCFQMLTPQIMNDLYLSKPVFCKSCGALMYLPEDRVRRR